MLILIAGGGGALWWYTRDRLARETAAAINAENAARQIRDLLAHSAELRDEQTAWRAYWAEVEQALEGNSASAPSR